MKVTYTEEINAEIVVTARLSADGELTAVASASCPYAEAELPGATASASMPLPLEQAEKIRLAFSEAMAKIAPELGKKIARAKADAYRTSVAQREIR